MQLHLDTGRVARHGLVHRVVQNLGHQVVQRAFIGAADIHTGAFADGFEAFQDLNGGRVVGVAGGGGQKVVGHVLLSCYL